MFIVTILWFITSIIWTLGLVVMFYKQYSNKLLMALLVVIGWVMTGLMFYEKIDWPVSLVLLIVSLYVSRRVPKQ